MDKTCEVCGAVIISPKPRKFCGGTCRVRAYKRRHPEKIKEARKAYYWSDPDRFRAVRKEEWDGKQWYNAVSKKVDRVCALFERMTQRQAARFADWLLKVDHRACHSSKSDLYIADFNSQGI